jgi:Predicted pyridoxal phosphate-dependent enzyme apparently involved in regulation of cell wall biogenesis
LRCIAGWAFTDGQFPHAERVGAGIVSLPLFPGMDEDDVERVCAAVSEVMRGALA